MYLRALRIISMNFTLRNFTKTQIVFNFSNQPFSCLPFCSKYIHFSTLQKSDFQFHVRKCWEQPSVNSPVNNAALCLHKQIIRYKTSKGKSRKKESEDKGSDDDNSDESDDEEDDDEGSYSDLEIDHEAPAVYKHIIVHSRRADNIIHKGLGISKSEIEKLFYSSKFMFGGKTLTKKAKQLNVGDSIDIVHSTSGKNHLVQRVKVIKISKRMTKSGKPIVIIRTWRKPFEANIPGS